jgi:hypothetical protein
MDELFDLALAIPKGPIANADDGQQWGSARGMIPDPIGADVEAMCHILGSQQWIIYLGRLRGKNGQRHKTQLHK